MSRTGTMLGAGEGQTAPRPPAKNASPRQPKLRSSCDRCGAAKLRCDRGQPSCGRCRALGQECVYGVSRKSCRKPRAKEMEHPSDASYTTGEPSARMDVDGLGPFPPVNHMLGDVMDDHAHDHLPRLHHLYPPSLTNFAPFDFDDWVLANYSGDGLLNTTTTTTAAPAPATTPAFTSLESAWQSTQKPVSHAPRPPDESETTKRGSVAGGRGHDCARDAYATLGSLSFLSLDTPPPAPPSSPVHSAQASASASASAPVSTPGSGNGVALDHVLRLNREANQQLRDLLTCPCARSPFLALLCASIVCRTLIWYQQAAGCCQNAFRSSAGVAVDKDPRVNPTLSPASASTSLSGSGSGSSPWLGVAAHNPGCGVTPASTMATDLSVTPSQIAIGSFNIDDPRVQASLRIQLVLSEMERASSVIDLFASQSSTGQGSVDGRVFCGADSLYRSLGSWLRGEHARVAGIMKSKLSELSDSYVLDRSLA